MKKNTCIITVLLAMMIYVTATYGQATDSLSSYLQFATENNPGLKADFLDYKASLQKIPQAGAYPDPELEIGVFPKPMDIIGGRQIAQFKLMQMFPWFGSKKTAQDEATHMAEASYEKFRKTRDKLYLDIYTQWYKLCDLQQQLIYNRENEALLKQLEELAIRKFSSPTRNSSTGYTSSPPTGMYGRDASPAMSSMGSANGAAPSQKMSAGKDMVKTGMASAMQASSPGMSDVLRIQLEIAEIENNIENLLSEIHAEKIRFNALLNRPPNSEVKIPASFEQVPFVFDETAAMAAIESRNPMLRMINEESLAYTARGEMDKKTGYPSFGVGVQYMLNEKTNDPVFGMGNMNGKDMVMPMISVSIPLYRNKYKARQQESRLRWQTSREKYTDTRNTLESELYKTKHLLDNASRKIALYEKQEELAKTTYHLVIREFIAGKSDLTNVIEVQRQLLNYGLKKAEAIAGYNTMVASIQRLISFNEDTEQRKLTYYEYE